MNKPGSNKTIKCAIYVEEEPNPYIILEIPLTKEGERNNEDNNQLENGSHNTRSH